MCEKDQGKGWTCLRECVECGVKTTLESCPHAVATVHKCCQTTRVINHINLRLFLFRITLHYRHHVCCVLLMCHTATDSINKLYIALFENAIVLIWSKIFPFALEGKSNMSQSREVRFA